MTGPAPGKLPVNAHVELCTSGGCRTIDARVYVHVKGWSRARVTHIDIEAPRLEQLIPGLGGRGAYVRVYGTRDGIVITPLNTPTWKLVIRTSDPLLHPLQPGESCIGFLGVKHGGVFLGLSSPYHRILEQLALIHRGVAPRSKARRIKPRKSGDDSGDEAPSGA